MVLLLEPSGFDVILTNNEFGDIISDEASVLAGSLGMIPSASMGDGGPGLFEPIHGSAPDIAGQGIANPLGAILTAALLMEQGLGIPEAGARIRGAVEATLEAGCRTSDLATSGSDGLSTTEMADEVLSRL
jgi:3-isopropylmalate dehydrogenase